MLELCSQGALDSVLDEAILGRLEICRNILKADDSDFIANVIKQFKRMFFAQISDRYLE